MIDKVHLAICADHDQITIKEHSLSTLKTLIPALGMTKTLLSFGCSECNRVNRLYGNCCQKVSMY